MSLGPVTRGSSLPNGGFVLATLAGFPGFCLRLTAMSRLLWLASALWLGLAGSPEQTSPASRAFERIRTLTGDWEGTVVWSGARTETGRMRASYSLTGNGSAVVENLIPEGEIVPAMTSIYHLDGADLRMTHYCGAKNQPRLKATRIEEDGASVSFAFVDATGLESHPAHVSAVRLQMLPADRLQIQFTFEGNGRTSIEKIDLQRGGSKSRDRGRKVLPPERI
jgi:hypothetical protein